MTDKYLDFINAHSGLKTEIYNVLDGHCNRKRNLMYPGNGMDLTGHFLDLTTEEKEIINSIKDSNKRNSPWYLLYVSGAFYPKSSNQNSEWENLPKAFLYVLSLGDLLYKVKTNGYVESSCEFKCAARFIQQKINKINIVHDEIH